MRRIQVQIAVLLTLVVLAAGALALIASTASAQRPGQQPAGATGQAATGALALTGQVTNSPAKSQPVQISTLNEQVYTIDLARLGIHPTAKPMPPSQAVPVVLPGAPRLLAPDGGALGTQNAFMSVSPRRGQPDHPERDCDQSANFTPSENVNFISMVPWRYLAANVRRLNPMAQQPARVILRSRRSA